MKGDSITKLEGISVKQNTVYGTVKIGDMFFSSVESFRKFMNGLEDVSKRFDEETEWKKGWKD